MPYLLYLDQTRGTVPTVEGYRTGVKWLHFYTDFAVSMGEIARGNMSAKDYLGSLGGEKEYAVWAWDDPLPMVAETLLLPYLKMVR
jgi:predicted ATP-grasp superfamily ATP-dependent carboligase